MTPIIEKLKKLLRLAKNHAATAEEAATAMRKALALAGEHGIDLSAIPPDDPEHGGMTHTTEPSQGGPAHRRAASLVMRHFGVETLFDSTGKKPVIHFIGFETNTQLALYCYIYLVRASRAAWRNRSNRRLRDRESFLRGYFRAIDQMMPAVFHQPGLVLSTANYVQGVIVAGRSNVVISQNKRAEKPISESAYMHGHMAGQNDGIRNAVRGTDKPLIA